MIDNVYITYTYLNYIRLLQDFIIVKFKKSINKIKNK